MKASLSPSYFVFSGPTKLLEASTRSFLMADKHLAKTDSAGKKEEKKVKKMIENETFFHSVKQLVKITVKGNYNRMSYQLE